MKKKSIHQLRNVLAVAVVGLIVGVAYVTNPSLFKASNAEAGTVNENVSGWAWSENTGWISFNNTNDGSAINYGVKVDLTNKATGGRGDFSGNAWSTASTTAYDSGIGWISFDRARTGNPPFPPFDGGSGPIAQVYWSTGKVTGWARALAGCDNVPAAPVATPCVTAGSGAGNAAGGWDGWISLSGLATDNSPYGVKITANKFSGYAWGSDVVGWIDFAPTVGGVPVGAQISAPPCTVDGSGNLVGGGTWGTCQASCVAGGGATQSVMGIKIGLCASGGTVTASCGPITQTCTSGSGSGGPVKLKYKQF